MSERTWPDNAWPTPAQWLDWLLTLDRDGQMRGAEKAIEARQAMALCTVEHYILRGDRWVPPTTTAQSPGNGPGRGLVATQSPGSVSGATDEPQGREAAK